MSVDSTENVFGCCPVCGMNDGYLNLGEEQWFRCDAHKKQWLFGSGWWVPIYSLEDGTPAEELLASYEPVPLQMIWPKA